MAVINTLITDALMDIGAINPEDTPSSSELAHGLRVFNRMIGSWAAENLLISYTTTESFSLVSGTAAYTMGSGGTASSSRAKRITDAYIRDSNSYDYPLTIIDQRRYNGILNKALSGRPDLLFYDPVYPVGVIYFYMTPGSGYTAYIESTKELHASLALAESVVLPGEYENAIVLNLANMLAPSYGVTVSQAMYINADKALRVIKNLNLSNRLETMDMPAGVGGAGRPYSIEAGV